MLTKAASSGSAQPAPPLGPCRLAPCLGGDRPSSLLRGFQPSSLRGFQKRPHRLSQRIISRHVVNAVSIFLTCAEVKFPRRRVAVISRLDELGLHFWVVDRGGAAAVPGLAS
jgi:hypothetical protein